MNSDRFPPATRHRRRSWAFTDGTFVLILALPTVVATALCVRSSFVAGSIALETAHPITHAVARNEAHRAVSPSDVAMHKPAARLHHPST